MSNINEISGDSQLFTPKNTAEVLFSSATSSDVLFYLGYASMLLSIWQKDPSLLVVVITRRCHVLLHAIDDFLERYYQAQKDIQSGASASSGAAKEFIASVPEKVQSLLRDFDYADYCRMVHECFITDIAMYGMADEFALHFIKNGNFPSIYVLDELLIHGRAINEFIHTFERNLETQFQIALASLGIPESQQPLSSVSDAFLEHLHIQVYLKNQESLMLLPRYAKRIECEETVSNIEWRKHSMHFARLISASNVNNAAFSWSFRIPTDAMSSVSAIGSVQGGFHHIATGLQKQRLDTFLSLYPNRQELRAVATVRFKESLSASYSDSAFSTSYLCVPFLIFNPVTPKAVYELHCRLLSALSDRPYLCEFLARHDPLFEADLSTGIKLYYRWLCETNDLILSALLMSCFMENVLHLNPSEQKQFCSYIDYDPLCRNFHSVDFPYDKTKDALSEVWQADILTQPSKNLTYYLGILTATPESAASEFLSAQDVPASAPFLADSDSIPQNVADVIAALGLEAERNAYTRYSSAVGYSEESLVTWGKKEALRDLLLRYQKLPDALSADSSDPDLIYKILAVIVQEMDLGALGMCPAITASDGVPAKIFTLQRAGEQALFILPIRYRNYLSSLRRIAEAAEPGSSECEILIRRFVRVLPEPLQHPRLEEQLIRFVQRLQWTGQALDEWDFNMSETFDKPDPRKPGLNENKPLLSYKAERVLDFQDQLIIQVSTERIV